MSTFGGVILCGGESRRMGTSKALLQFGDETMLQRVVKVLTQIVQPIVVVAAEKQKLPPLPTEVLIARDDQPGQGPLEGLRVGLSALSDADAAFVTSCDVPLLKPEFVRYLLASLGEYEIAVPVEAEKFHHPLAAVYRPSVAAEISSLLSTDRRRPLYLFDAVKTLRVPVEELRTVDPELDSLRNLNHPEDYRVALERAGLS